MSKEAEQGHFLKLKTVRAGHVTCERSVQAEEQEAQSPEIGPCRPLHRPVFP